MRITYVVNNHTRSIEPNTQGYYEIPITDRYSLPGVEIEHILAKLNLVYVGRPPGKDYEYWRLNVPVPQAGTTHGIAGTFVNGNLTGTSS